MHGTITTQSPIPHPELDFICPFQMMPIPSTTTAAQQPSWLDEFFDFSSARRSSHRRTARDPVAFIEASFVEEYRNSSGGLLSSENNGFDRLDDAQLRSMFSDDIAAAAAIPPSTRSSSNPSTPSCQNSENEEKPTLPDHHQHQPKNEPIEVDSSCQPETQPPTNPSNTIGSGDAIVDPKRVKRILANRQSAQRSRVRKLQYISELERSVTTLQTEVSALSPRVAFLDHQRLILNVDNSALKQRIAALAQDKIFKDAHQEALKKETEKLRQVYHEQSLKKMSNKTSSAPPQPPTFKNTGCTDE